MSLKLGLAGKILVIFAVNLPLARVLHNAQL